MEPGSQQKNYFTRVEVAELFEVAPNTVKRMECEPENCRVSDPPGGRRRYPIEPILRFSGQFREGADTTASMGVFFVSRGYPGWAVFSITRATGGVQP